MHLENLGQYILHQSLQITLIILMVYLIRGLFLKKFSRKYAYALWAVVGIRLLFPGITIARLELPSLWQQDAITTTGTPKNTKQTTITNDQTGQSSQSAQDKPTQMSAETENISSSAASKDISQAATTKQTDQNNEETPSLLQSLKQAILSIGKFLTHTDTLVFIWLTGMLLFWLRNGYLLFQIKRRTAFAVRLRDNIYETEGITTPFVLGIGKPKIYIPFDLPATESNLILEHETYHIRRRDYLVNYTACFLLSVYWFHPFVLLAYRSMIKDMEMSCDEHVLENLARPEQIRYSETLLHFAMKQGNVTAGMLCFGENDTKERVKNVLHYQKQKKWIRVIGALVVLIAGTLCLLHISTTSTENQKQTVAKHNTLEDKILTNPGTVVVIAPNEKPVELDIDQDGKKDKISMIKLTEPTEVGEAVLQINDATCETMEFGYTKENAVISAISLDGESIYLIRSDRDEDYSCTQFYWYDGTRILLAGEIPTTPENWKVTNGILSYTGIKSFSPSSKLQTVTYKMNQWHEIVEFDPEAEETSYFKEDENRVGQLGEEGLYYSRKENATRPEQEYVLYETTADLTHDGIDDLVQLVCFSLKTSKAEQLNDSSAIVHVKVYRGKADHSYEKKARFISRSFADAHVGNGQLCLTQKDGLDYLMVSDAYEMQGSASYGFGVFYIDDQTSIQKVDEASVNFAVDEEEGNHWKNKLHREDVMPSLRKSIEPWLENTQPLIIKTLDSSYICTDGKERYCPQVGIFGTENTV